MSDTSAAPLTLDAAPREAHWHVEIIIGRDVVDDRADVKPYAGGKPAVIGTETETVDGFTAQEHKPTVKQLNALVPEGWRLIESTVNPTGH